MASELAEARSKTITNKLIDDIISNIETEGGFSGVRGEAAAWWNTHRTELVGLAIAEVIAIFRNAKNKKELSARYDALVASMSWKERLEFLRGGIEELRKSNSKKIRTAVLITEVLQIGLKVLPIILMAL